MRDYSSLDRFLNSIEQQVYPEPPSEPHLLITRMTIESLLKEGLLPPGSRVLDVGCGQGLALGLFRNAGLDAVGITLGSDAAICRENGFDVHDMDQNFLTFEDGSFDFLWCRHVLEHSIAPTFTLTEYYRLLRTGGLAYIEVPAPDTSAHHEMNPNHYSVLTSSSWLCLFARSGFLLERRSDITFMAQCGADLYWSFLLRRIL